MRRRPRPWASTMPRASTIAALFTSGRFMSSLSSGGIAVVVVPVQPLHQVVAVAHRHMARRVGGIGAGRQAFDDLVHSRVEEIRQGIAVAAGAVDHAVRCRDIAVVGPARQHVGDVEHEGARQRRRVDPFSHARAHLQSAGIILRQQRDDAVVGVRRGAELFRIRLRRLRRIVQQAQEGGRLAKEAVERIGRHVQRHGDQPDHVARQRVDLAQVALDRRPEGRQPVRPLVGALQRLSGEQVGIVRRQFVHQHQRLAEVRAGDPRDARGDDGRRGQPHVAAMETVDRNGLLLFQARRMELPRRVERALQRLVRHRVVGDVGEADGCQRMVQLPCRLRRRGAASVEAVAQVHDGDGFGRHAASLDELGRIKRGGIGYARNVPKGSGRSPAAGNVGHRRAKERFLQAR